jgi:hypothetical protein
MSTHQMDAADATGTVKVAHTTILTAMMKQVDAGRIETIFVGRDLAANVDPDRTHITLEGYEAFADSLGLEIGDLWEDYREREIKITEAAMNAAEVARAKAENGDSLSLYADWNLDALPQWAQDELQRLLHAAAVNRRPERGVQQRPLGSRETRTLHNVIGALVETCLDRSPGGQRFSIFASQAALIDALVARYPNLAGVTQRTLEGLIPKARKSMKEM